MKIQIATAIILLSTFVLSFSGCDILKSFGSRGSYSELLSKKQELADFQPTLDPAASPSASGSSLSADKKPTVKGKVVIVINHGNGYPELDRFDGSGEFSVKPAGSAATSLFYPPEVYAKNLEEIGTLIKIECEDKKDSDYYKEVNGNSPARREEYTKTVCDVSVIDYKTKSLLAKVQKGNNFSPSTITVGKYGVGQESNGSSQVFKEISIYLNSLPVELMPRVKATPNGAVITFAELAKSYNDSKDSPSPYQDKEVTVTGCWGTLTASHDNLFLYGNEKGTGSNTLSCKIEPTGAAGFAGVKELETQKFTVIGKFNGKYNMTLENCRLIDAEKTESK
jgi:hypothetical protein